MATIDFLPHPITTEGRQTLTAMVPQGQSLDKVLVGIVPPSLSAVAVVNGTLISRPKWQTTLIERDSIIQVRAMMHGGDGSNPFAVILSIAAVVFAPYLAAAIFSSAFAGTLAGSLVTAAIGAGGVLVANALFPPRLPSDVAAADQERQYSLSGGSNRARPHEPFLLLLGKHRVFPDLVSREYTEFRTSTVRTGGDPIVVDPSLGTRSYDAYIPVQTSYTTPAGVRTFNSQIIFQLFDFGIGKLTLENHRLKETLLTEFSDVETQAQETITLVHGNVDTIPGGDLEPSVSLTRRTAINTTKIVFQLVSQNYTVTDEGNIVAGQNAFKLEWRAVGTTTWTERNVIMYNASTQISRNQLERRYYPYDVTKNQYDVRVTLTTVWDTTNDRLQASASLFAINAHQPQVANFSGRNPYAMKIRATGQLYGRVETLNADGKQLIPVWNGTAWVADQETSNPAWIMRKFWQGWRRPSDSRLMAGMGLADTRIDDESLKAWGEFCDDNELTFNLVEDSRISDEELEMRISQCGWGFVTKETGKRGMRWENHDQPVTAVFTPANIVAGSMAISWENQGLADEIVGKFLDSESDYEENTIRRLVPGVGTPERPVTVPLTGITNGKQAAKEINRMAASQFYHARVLSWESVLRAVRGDVVALAHDLAGGSIGGRIISINAARNKIETTAEIPLLGTIWIWDLNGDVNSYAFTRAGSIVSLSSKSLPLPPPGIADNPLSYQFMAFDLAADPLKVRITGIEHAVGGVFRYTARNEVAQYYAARVSDLNHDLLPPRERYRAVSSQALEVARELGGRDGRGFEFIFRRTTTDDAPSTPDTTEAERQENEHLPSQWTDGPLGTSELLPFEWMCYRVGSTQSWGPFLPATLAVLWGKYTEPFDAGGTPSAPLVGALSQGGGGAEFFFLVGVAFTDTVHVKAVTKAQLQITASDDSLFASTVHDVELSRPPVHWTVRVGKPGKYLFRSRLWNEKADSGVGVWSGWSVAVSRNTETGQEDSGLAGPVQDFFVEDNEEAAGNTARVYLREPATNSKSIWAYDVQAKKTPLWGDTVEDTIGVRGIRETGTAGTVEAGGHLLTDTTQTWTVDEWVGKILYLHDGIDTATGKVSLPHAYPIRGNTATVLDVGTTGSYSFPFDATGNQKYLIADRWQKTPDDLTILETKLVYADKSLPGHSPDRQHWQWSFPISSPCYWRVRPLNQPGFGPWNYYDGVEPT